MTFADDVADQLAAALRARLVDGLAALGWTELATAAADRLPDTVSRTTAHLLGDDEGLAVEAVASLAGIAWPDPPAPAWWSTPLGRAVARSARHTATGAVTFGVGATMLGVTKSTVQTLTERGTLTRHPDGGVALASILDRAARQAV